MSQSLSQSQSLSPAVDTPGLQAIATKIPERDSPASNVTPLSADSVTGPNGPFALARKCAELRTQTFDQPQPTFNVHAARQETNGKTQSTNTHELSSGSCSVGTLEHLVVRHPSSSCAQAGDSIAFSSSGQRSDEGRGSPKRAKLAPSYLRAKHY